MTGPRVYRTPAGVRDLGGYLQWLECAAQRWEHLGHPDNARELRQQAQQILAQLEQDTTQLLTEILEALDREVAEQDGRDPLGVQGCAQCDAGPAVADPHSLGCRLRAMLARGRHVTHSTRGFLILLCLALAGCGVELEGETTGGLEAVDGGPTPGVQHVRPDDTRLGNWCLKDRPGTWCKPDAGPVAVDVQATDSGE